MRKYFYTRRDFLTLTGIGVLGIFVSLRGQNIIKKDAKELLVYVGTYTTAGSEGIYIYRMDLSSGKLNLVKTVKEIVNPSFLAIDAMEHYLYTVNEVQEFVGKPGGAISAYSINLKTGDLSFLNQQPTQGGDPCHIIVDKTGKFVLTANYSGGSVSVFPVLTNGSLGTMTDIVQHYGSGPNIKRQETPHAHSVNLDFANRYAFVADLGLDKIMIYKFDSNKGKLNPNDVPWASVKAGAGPRHFTFHPDGKFAYVINELNSTLTAFSYDETKGTLKELQAVSTIPEDFTGTNWCADVHVSPSGKFVYGSNRGHNSIVIFAIDEGTGKLIYVGHEPTQGNYPRNFAIDPTGSFLLAANQRTNNIVIFRIDKQNGRLISTGQTAELPSPVCIKMIPFYF